MQVVIYIPKKIYVISSHSIVVSFDTPDGNKDCKYSASSIQSGVSAVSDCDDVEYWNLTNPIDVLREFDKSIGALFFLNSFDAKDAPTKIKFIEIFQESNDNFPTFKIVFEPPTSAVICSVDDKKQISVKSTNVLPEFYNSGSAQKTLVEILYQFGVTYGECRRRSRD